MDKFHETEDFYTQHFKIDFEFKVDLRIYKYYSLLDIITLLGGLGASIGAVMKGLTAYFTIQYFLVLGVTLQKLARYKVKMMKI